MTNEDIGAWIVIAVFALAVWLVWRAVTRRQSRDSLADEIMSKHYDERAMSQAIVEAVGDNEKARRIYIQRRMKEHSRASSSRLRGHVWEWFLVLWGIGVLASLVYKAYAGDLFWWWDGGSASRETMIGLLWIATLVLVPYFTHAFAARRRVSSGRATTEVLGATFAAFVLLYLFSKSIVSMML